MSTSYIVSPSDSRPSTKRGASSGNRDANNSASSSSDSNAVNYPYMTPEVEEAAMRRAEAAYCKLFHLSCFKDPFLDRISLLACSNQGIDPSELLPIPRLELFAEGFYKTHPKPRKSGGATSNNASRSRKQGSVGRVRDKRSFTPAGTATSGPATPLRPLTHKVGTQSLPTSPTPYTQRGSSRDANNNTDKITEQEGEAATQSPIRASTTHISGEEEQQQQDSPSNNNNTLTYYERRMLKLQQDTVLTTAHAMQLERQLVKLKIVQKERQRLVEVLMRGAAERKAREDMENDMMRRPKRRRDRIPTLLLVHDENTLHAQLTGQETTEQIQYRSHTLELRKAIIMGDFTIDEGMGDRIPGSEENEGLDEQIETYVEAVLRRGSSFVFADKVDDNDDEGGNSGGQDGSNSQSPSDRRGSQSVASSTTGKRNGKRRMPRRPRGLIARNPAERDAVRTLLNVQSSSQEAEAKFEQEMLIISKKGKEKIESVRKRYMNAMVSDINKMQEREELLEYLTEREEAWKAMNAKRKQELHDKVVAADMLRNKKMVQHELEASRVAAERKARLEDNIERRDVRLKAIEDQNERDRQQRLEVLEREMQENRERLAARERELAAKAEVQREETTAKMSLHGARKANLTVRRDVLLATRSHDGAKRQEVAGQKRSEAITAYTAALEVNITAREKEAAERKEHQQQLRRDAIRRQNEEIERRIAEAEYRRYENEHFRQQWCEAIDEQWEEKQDHVDTLTRERDEDARKRRELALLKEEAHAESVQRLERITAYTQSVRKAVVDSQIAHNESRANAEKHHRDQLRWSRTNLAHKQEIVQTSIQALMNGNKFPTDRAELEQVIDAMSPESRRKQHQVDNARRELRNAKENRTRQLLNGSGVSTANQASQFPSATPSRIGTRGGVASSPAALPPGRLASLDTSQHGESAQTVSSPVDEIIKRIRRSR